MVKAAKSKSKKPAKRKTRKPKSSAPVKIDIDFDKLCQKAYSAHDFVFPKCVYETKWMKVKRWLSDVLKRMDA